MRFIIFLFFLSIPISFSNAQSGDIFIQSDLSLGSVGEDVRLLQIALNKDDRTRVSSTGPGSRGEETNFFGPKTERAVILFQELHKEAILSPLKLSAGTGFVGENTRKILNTTTPILTELEKSEEMPVLFIKQAPFLYNINPYQLKPGDVATISGRGFLSSGNEVFLGSKSLGEYSSNGTSISVQIPENTPYGSHKIRVKNRNGETEDSQTSIGALVVENPSAPPKIVKTEPESLLNEPEIVLFGENFAELNDVYSSVGEILGLTISQGSTVRIPLSMLTRLDDLKKDIKLDGFEFPIYFFVKNENGISEPFMVLIKL
ncbi:MAG: hypothetical protein AB200_02355 [Parcubacteria bacterium C7867-005]|nr:MAG: hypothetical protein AB200_02355 [Parcubacteria bacterium C7867-005]